MDSIVVIVVVVFVLALIGALVRKFRKDPCLEAVDTFHVTFLGGDGRTLWGDALVTSQGLELFFDAAHRDERGLEESGAILYATEISNMVAIARSVHGMTSAERKNWEAQIRRILRPGRWRRCKRYLANVGGMIRDAVVDTLGLLLGQLGSKSKPIAVLAEREKKVSEIGGSMLDLGARAYEPLLERHMGQPVVLRIDLPGTEHAKLYFPGYLGDYNEKFLFVVNESHAAEEALRIAAGDGTGDSAAWVELDGDFITIQCRGEDAVVVKRLVGAAGAFDLGAVLVAGCRIEMHLPPSFGFLHAEVERTRKLDLLCPRARCEVEFSGSRPPQRRSPWTGIGPGR